jgi:AraC family transcriptional regulator of adaptative response / DNA-3-methyladenine glycosylase II
VIHDADQCWRIVERRDARFDGRFIVAVATTRIYCRPSCPATTPHRKNVRFYPSAAAAQQAGFRACRRCRPDAAPGSPEWNVRSDAVARAMRMIADGVVDRAGVHGLARHLGYSERHLTRLITEELGAGPLAIARAQRAQTARTLLETTDLKITDVAFAAGFASVRQFNDTVRDVFAATPSELRRGARTKAPPEPGRISLRLPYRTPFPASATFGFLGARTIGGIEAFDSAKYARTLRLPRGVAIATVTPSNGHLAVGLELDDVADLSVAVARLRQIFDLDADPAASDGWLRRDPALRALIRRGPGRRVPGSADATELVVRAVLGQQISVAGARTLAGRLVAALGTPIPGRVDHLTHVFPTAAEIAASPLDMVGIPASRRTTLQRVCTAIADGSLVLDAGADRDETRNRLQMIKGIGPWTANYVAMRALHDPDAFLPTDLGVRHAANTLGLPNDPRGIEQHAEQWRPWRAYALQYLWSTLDEGASE